MAVVGAGRLGRSCLLILPRCVSYTFCNLAKVSIDFVPAHRIKSVSQPRNIDKKRESNSKDERVVCISCFAASRSANIFSLMSRSWTINNSARV